MKREHGASPGYRGADADHHAHASTDHRRDAEAHRDPLPRGAGAGRLLFFDAFSGIAGDMTIAALVDLGVPFDEVQKAVASLALDGVSLELEASRAGAIGATSFDVVVRSEQPHRAYRDIDALIGSSSLSEGIRGGARAIFRTLAEAEARVHRIALEDVHFHEVGAVDAIVDILGAAACLDYLGARVVCTPLPVGRGMIHCEHGVLPSPAPATVECLRGAPTVDSGIDFELVTPTGAAIVKTVATRFVRWPDFAPVRIGWGRGKRTLDDRPNALRVVLGDPSAPADRSAGGSYAVVEANVDDMTGELAAHAIERLLDSGALDAWATPVTMKKGRPGLTIAALAPAALRDAVAEVMLRETTTIGVRYRAVERLERPRQEVSVKTEFGEIPVKVSAGPFGPEQIKPEFSVCAVAARAAGVPVREVIAAALRAARRR